MELMIINTVLAIYICCTLYHGYFKRHILTDGAYHHLLTHAFIVMFFLVAINLYVYEGQTIWLVFSFLHVVQHFIKENIRLLSTNRWTMDVKDEYDH